jgi:predicted Zn-dependent protease
VISVRFEVYSKAGKWDAAAEMADRLVSLEPHEPGSWIALAYATRRKPGGGILQAREILLPAQTRFPEVWLIPYNLACYECQLGNQNEARTWLDKAFAIGDPKTIKMMALADPDLEPLRGALGETEI